MRRSASEIIRNLERRIARLESLRQARDTFAIAEEVQAWAMKNEGRKFGGRTLELHMGRGSSGLNDEGLVFVGRGESYELGDFVMCNYLGEHGIDKIECTLMRDFQDVRDSSLNVSGMTSDQIIKAIIKSVSKF